MNTDIRFAVNFLDHPKFIKLERRLGWPGIKSLLRLWCWSAQYRPDGIFKNMSDEDIELAAQWNNEPLTFVTTLVELRLLDVEKNIYSIHGWLDYNGFAASAPDRSDRARFSRMAKTHPEIYNKMKETGVISITSEEYHRLTTYQRPVERPLTNRSTFSLSPSPSPSPSLKNTPLPPKGDLPLFPEAEQKTTKNKIDYRQVDFNTFWRAYPKKKAKPAAKKNWDKCCREKTLPDIDTILFALEQHKASADWIKNDGQYIPFPQKWINEQRWEDSIDATESLQLPCYEIFDPEVDCL